MRFLLKENRIVKLSIVFSLLMIFLLGKIKQSNRQIEGFVHEPSFSIGEDIVFSLIGNYEKSSTVRISSLTNDFDENIEIESFQTSQQGNVLLKGVSGYYANRFNSKDMGSGIYLINDTIPFVVKGPNLKSEIVVVYPYVNNLINTQWRGKTIGSETSTFTHLFRSNFIDEISSEMKMFFEELSDNYSVKYISDIDLEYSMSIEDAELVIFYSNILYATSSMKNNLLNFIHSGGDVLMASTYFLNNVIWKDSKEPNIIVLNRDAKNKGVLTKERYGVSLWEVEGKYIDDYIGLSYAKGGFSKGNNGYEVVWQDSPLFKNLSMKRVPVHGYDFIGVDGERKDGSFYFNLPENIRVRVHAYVSTMINGTSGITGIMELQLSEESGKILSLGTNLWFSDWNYGKSQDIRDVTDDAIAYLVGH